MAYVPPFKKGDIVTPNSDSEVNFEQYGLYDGERYTVEEVDFGSYVTYIKLKEVSGEFNSVLFSKVTD